MRLKTKAPQMSEKQFLAQVIELAKLYGWSCAHFRSARIQRKDGSHYYATPVQADGEGWPDLVMARPPRLIFAEIKSESGIPSEAQMDWINCLNLCPPAEAYLWRPKDFDHIVAILEEK